MAVTTLSAEIKAPFLNPAPAPAVNSLDINFTAPAVAVDGIDFVAQGNEIIEIINTHATTAQTFTITSAADDLGRTGDITTYSLAAGEATALRLSTFGWANASTGKILITMSDVTVKVRVLRISGLVN